MKVGVMALPLVIFGIKISRKYFGKKLKKDVNLFLSYSPVYRKKIAMGEVDVENYYGKGDFIPFDVVQMQNHPSDSTLMFNLCVFEENESHRLKLGDVVKTSTNEKCTIFGYKLPNNWEESGIKIINDSNNQFLFVLTKNNQILSQIFLPLVGIVKHN